MVLFDNFQEYLACRKSLQFVVSF